MGVCTKERKGVTAEVLMATPCTNSLGGESGGHKHGGDEGCRERQCIERDDGLYQKREGWVLLKDFKHTARRHTCRRGG